MRHCWRNTNHVVGPCGLVPAITLADSALTHEQQNGLHCLVAVRQQVLRLLGLRVLCSAIGSPAAISTPTATDTANSSEHRRPPQLLCRPTCLHSGSPPGLPPSCRAWAPLPCCRLAFRHAHLSGSNPAVMRSRLALTRAGGVTRSTVLTTAKEQPTARKGMKNECMCSASMQVLPSGQQAG